MALVALLGASRALAAPEATLAAQNFTSIATGLNLSITCAEDIPFMTEADVACSSAGTFMGAARVRAQQLACTI